MNREQLAPVLRAAAQIVEDPDIVGGALPAPSRRRTAGAGAAAGHAGRLGDRAGTLSADELADVDDALRTVLSL